MVYTLPDDKFKKAAFNLEKAQALANEIAALEKQRVQLMNEAREILDSAVLAKQVA